MHLLKFWKLINVCWTKFLLRPKTSLTCEFESGSIIFYRFYSSQGNCWKGLEASNTRSKVRHHRTAFKHLVSLLYFRQKRPTFCRAESQMIEALVNPWQLLFIFRIMSNSLLFNFLFSFFSNPSMITMSYLFKGVVVISKVKFNSTVFPNFSQEEVWNRSPKIKKMLQ